MPSPTLETRTYVGQTGTPAFDGWAGFFVGRQYQLYYERVAGQVRIQLEHRHCAFVLPPLVVSEAQFEKWWVR